LTEAVAAPAPSCTIDDCTAMLLTSRHVCNGLEIFDLHWFSARRRRVVAELSLDITSPTIRLSAHYRTSMVVACSYGSDTTRRRYVAPLRSGLGRLTRLAKVVWIWRASGEVLTGDPASSLTGPLKAHRSSAAGGAIDFGDPSGRRQRRAARQALVLRIEIAGCPGRRFDIARRGRRGGPAGPRFRRRDASPTRRTRALPGDSTRSGLSSRRGRATGGAASCRRSRASATCIAARSAFMTVEVHGQLTTCRNQRHTHDDWNR
jgi:hypothetical protein